MRNYTNEEIHKRRQIKENILNKIKFVLVIIISIVVIYNITLIYQSIINPDKTPSFLGKKTFTIISGSMEPSLEIGDIVIVEEIEEKDLKENDIITFRRNNEMITHRIVKMEKEKNEVKYITKGDNNMTEDAEEVIYKNIEGKVIKTIKHVGNIVIVLKDKLTILAIVFIFVIIYMFDMKRQSKIEMRKNKKELLNRRRNQ